MIHGTIWLLSGLYVNARFPSQYVEILSTDEMPFGSFLWLLVVPASWMYYLWLPRATEDMEAALRHNQVVGTRTESESVLLRLIQAHLHRLVITVIVVLSVVFVLVVYYWIFLPGEIATGRETFWAATPWLLGTLGFLIGLNSYIILQTVARVLFLATALHRFFDSDLIDQVYVSHPDQSGGLGTIGQLTLRLGVFAVLLGIWASWIALLPVGISGEITFNAATVVLYLAYGSLAIINFFLLLWPAHTAMLRYKHKRLKTLSFLMQDVYSQLYDEEADLSKINSQLSLLDDLYEKVSKMPEWPIPTWIRTRFGIVSSLPGLVGVFISVYELLQPSPGSMP